MTWRKVEDGCPSDGRWVWVLFGDPEEKPQLVTAHADAWLRISRQSNGYEGPRYWAPCEPPEPLPAPPAAEE